MVCVVNPDGTITCSDGDELAVQQIAKKSHSVTGAPSWGGRVDVAAQLKTVEAELRGSASGKIVLLVDATAPA